MSIRDLLCCVGSLENPAELRFQFDASTAKNLAHNTNYALPTLANYVELCRQIKMHTLLIRMCA